MWIMLNLLRVHKQLSGRISRKENQLQEIKETVASSAQQLHDVKETVVTSVETVKTDLKSYSEALQSSGGSVADPATFLNKSLKDVVQDIVHQEDKNRTVMIFGMSEEPSELINDKISEVFLDLAEKPKLEACRIGKKKSDSSKTQSRPVRVSLSNSTIVQQILSKSKSLRNSERFKDVFISPDRTVKERQQQRELVTELKKRKTDEPNKRHFIKSGQVISSDKADIVCVKR